MLACNRLELVYEVEECGLDLDLQAKELHQLVKASVCAVLGYCLAPVMPSDPLELRVAGGGAELRVRSSALVLEVDEVLARHRLEAVKVAD